MWVKRSVISSLMPSFSCFHTRIDHAGKKRKEPRGEVPRSKDEARLAPGLWVRGADGAIATALVVRGLWAQGAGGAPLSLSLPVTPDRITSMLREPQRPSVVPEGRAKDSLLAWHSRSFTTQHLSFFQHLPLLCAFCSHPDLFKSLWVAILRARIDPASFQFPAAAICRALMAEVENFHRVSWQRVRAPCLDKKRKH